MVVGTQAGTRYSPLLEKTALRCSDSNSLLLLLSLSGGFWTLGPVYVRSRFWNGLSTRYGLSYICTSMLCFVSVRSCVRVVFVCMYPCSTYCIKRSCLGFSYYSKMTLYKRH